MRFLNTAATIAAALVTSAVAAGAQVGVTGTTTGCFGLNCSTYGSTASYAIGNTGASVDFTGTSFTGMTNPVTNGFTVGNFGSLILSGLSGTTLNTMFSTPFTLLFTLSAPAGASSPTSTFAISGFVGNTNGMGARDIQYSAGSPAAFTFANGSGTIAIDGGQIGPVATAISGRVTAVASTVPEPSTYALMGMGLAGMFAAVRRRRDISA